LAQFHAKTKKTCKFLAAILENHLSNASIYKKFQENFALAYISDWLSLEKF
jgi:hypothetical protein